jgi:hypothetical protein
MAMKHSIALDLAATDLADYDSLLGFVVAHTIAPVRAAYGLPAPQPDEGHSYFVERTEKRADGMLVEHIRSYNLKESTRLFDPVIRALLLFGWLFPKSVMPSQSPERVLEAPGWSVLLQSLSLVDRPYEAIAHLVGGLLEVSIPRPWWTGSSPLEPATNVAALADLSAMRSLIKAALSAVTEDPHSHLIDIGLDRIDPVVAWELDEIARSDVRRRFVWLGTYESFDPDDSETEALFPETFERGVFAADLPETLKGLIALDYSEQLSQDRSTGRCEQCGALMEVEGRQRGRVRRREPVYHPGCRDEHRLIYFRRKSHDRYAQVRGNRA